MRRSPCYLGRQAARACAVAALLLWSSAPEAEGWPADEYIRYLQWLEDRRPDAQRFVRLVLIYLYEPIDRRRPGERPLYPLLVCRGPD